LQVTLDGTRDIHNKRRVSHSGESSFDKIIENIKMAIASGLKIVLRVNVDEENIDNLPELADFLVEKFGKTELLKPYIYLLQDGGCSGEQNVIKEADGIKKVFELEEHYPNISIFYKKYHPANFIGAIFNNKPFQPLLTHCGASRNQYILDVKGNIYKCWHGIGNNSYSIGRIDEKALFNDKSEKWKERSIVKLDKCLKCKYRYLCGTGCPAARHSSNDEFNISEPNCVDYETLLNALITLRLNKRKPA
jgi:uncharacterized protein